MRSSRAKRALQVWVLALSPVGILLCMPARAQPSGPDAGVPPAEPSAPAEPQPQPQPAPAQPAQATPSPNEPHPGAADVPPSDVLPQPEPTSPTETQPTTPESPAPGAPREPQHSAPAPQGANAAGTDIPGWGEADDDIGFGDAPEAPAPTATTAESRAVGTAPAAQGAPATEPGTLEASGNLGHRLGLWSERMDSEPLARAQLSADLAIRYKKPFHVGGDRLLLRLVGEGSLEYDLAYLHDRARFDRPTLDAYEWNVIGRETYAALSWGALELTVGRQIVVWGQGELLSPLDIVNPRDNREPGLTELADMRMAVLASRAGLFFGAHRLEAMVVHESYFGLRPAPLSDMSPLRKLILADQRIATLLAGKQLGYVDLPGRFVDGGAQFYARYAYSGAGIDLAFYAASTLDKTGIPEAPGAADLAGRDVAFRLWHPRYAMFGHSGAKPLGDVVLRWELGVELNRPLSVQLDPQHPLALDLLRRHQLNGMLGLSYEGITDTRVTLEYAQSLVLDNPERDRHDSRRLLRPVETPAWALRVRRAFLRERLVATLIGTFLGLDPFVGAFARAELEYELFPAFHVGAGYALYLPSAHELGPFYGFEHNDRLYASVRWHFLLD